MIKIKILVVSSGELLQGNLSAYNFHKTFYLMSKNEHYPYLGLVGVYRYFSTFNNNPLMMDLLKKKRKIPTFNFIFKKKVFLDNNSCFFSSFFHF